MSSYHNTKQKLKTSHLISLGNYFALKSSYVPLLRDSDGNLPSLLTRAEVVALYTLTTVAVSLSLEALAVPDVYKQIYRQ